VTLASIPYRTFPEIHLGPISLHTFGLIVAVGMFAGVMITAAYAERRGVSREIVYKLGVRFVVWGIIGARIAWVVSHPSQVHSLVDVIALWQGGLTFTGGFMAAAIAGVPILRRLPSVERWYLADGIALGLALGVGIGRIGCYAVGEHLGAPTSFFLGVRYLGGPTREGPLLVEVVYHNTAVYEFLHLMMLSALLAWLLFKMKDFTPGTAMGIFCLWYGVARFSTDFFRSYDQTKFGLTAAQYLCLVLVPIGIWILATRKKRFPGVTAADDGGSAAGASDAAGRGGARFQSLGGYAVATGIALAVSVFV
jgi:phosphatidylglycerol:prolipoprotein diacylglycerol transferase